MDQKKGFRFLPLLLLLAAVCILPAVFPARTEAASAKWIQKNNKWRYRNSRSVYLKSGFYEIRDKWYYFDKNGYVKTGWIKLNGKFYYGTKASAAGEAGVLKSGWVVAKSGKTYYFDQTQKAGEFGTMASGWTKISGQIFFFNAKGVMMTGFQKIDGNTYYFRPDGATGSRGKIVTGWYEIDGKMYGFKEDGNIGEYGRQYKNEWGLKTGTGMDTRRCHFDKQGLVDKKSRSKAEFVPYIGKLAKKDMEKSNILASVTAAQAILESGFGQSLLSLSGKNLFGIKASKNGKGWEGTTWTGKVYTAKTSEYLNGKHVVITSDFRAYSSWAKSLADHSAYLTNAMKGSVRRYEGVVGNKSYANTFRLIKNGGYATDPTYVTSLIKIVEKYNLTQYDVVDESSAAAASAR